jgi:type III pantothenate kinase
MLLAIDIGNTNVVLGVFAGAELTQSWRLASQPMRTADDLGIMIAQLFVHRQIAPAEISGVIIASVVPEATGTMSEVAARYLGHRALVVDSALDTGMPNLYQNPAEVGSDRIVNGVAAFERHGRKAGKPVIVVDFGTATTFDAISREGEYLGGVICPGVQISADALYRRTAKLPRIAVARPESVIGRTTIGSMQSGLFYGYIGLVEGIVRRIESEFGGPATTVATGGLAESIALETGVIQVVDRDLTLHGLRIIWDRNRQATA